MAPIEDAEAPPADPPPSEATDAETAKVVLLVVEGTDDVERAEAIEAHLSGLDVGVETVAIDEIRGELVAKHAIAEGAARARDALGAFWVESPRKGTLELYLVQPGRREVMRREISLDPRAPQASVEAVGIVARSITSALASGMSVEMEAIPLPEPQPAPEPEPAPAPKPAPAPPPDTPRERGRARLAVGYVGTSYAREVAWQSGLGLGAGWVWPFGLHVAAEYAVMQRVRAVETGAAIVVARHPIAAAVGWGHRFGSVFVEGEAVAILDYAVRRSTSGGDLLAPAPDRGRVTFGLGPRGRLAVVAAWRVELYLQVGVEFWLSTVRYAIQRPDGSLPVVLQPRRVRAHTGAGVAVRI